MRGGFRLAGRGAIAIALGALLALALAAPAGAASPLRPFAGSATGSSTLGPPAPGDCPAGSNFFVTDSGTGNFTHLGRVHYALHHCAVFDFGTGTGSTTSNGSMTIVAANGDTLTLSYSFTFTATPLPVPTTAAGDAHWTVAGGTGRFEGAQGSGGGRIKVAYTPDLSGAMSSFAWWGTIAY